MTHVASCWKRSRRACSPGSGCGFALLPITLFTVPWCGVDPRFIGVMEVVVFGSIVFGVATTLALSLWSGQTFVALMGVYVSGADRSCTVSANRVSRRLARGSSMRALTFCFRCLEKWPRPSFGDACLFLGLTLGAATLLLVLMAATLRPVMRSSLATLDQATSAMGCVPRESARVGPSDCRVRPRRQTRYSGAVVARSELMGRTDFLDAVRAGRVHRDGIVHSANSGVARLAGPTWRA